MPTVSATNIPTPQVLQSGGFASPSGKIVDNAYRFFLDLVTYVTSLVSAVNAAVGVNRFTLAAQPLLGPADAGFLGFVTDYGHFVTFDGAVWSFAAGDVGNGFYRDFAIVPQEAGWHLVDGSATDYLVVGAAALSATAITPPNLPGSAAYRKSVAAYTGVINPASGQTADESAHTHVVPDQNTADEAAHTHASGALTAVVTPDGISLAEFVSAGGTAFHIQTGGTTAAGSAHHHDVPSQPTQAGSAHHHGAGTIDMPNLGVLVYFRR